MVLRQMDAILARLSDSARAEPGAAALKPH